MNPVLSDRQKAEYRENGYLVVREVVPAEEAVALRRIAEASVSSESLGFFDGDAAFDYQVDICFADGVKSILPPGPCFGIPADFRSWSTLRAVCEGT